MKSEGILLRLLIAFCALVFSSAPVQADVASKILLIILEDQPISQAIGSEPGANIKIVSLADQSGGRMAEALIAKQLFGANYEVVTSDEVVPSSGLSIEDIAQAKKGSVPKAQKVAAFHDANLIFSGSIKTGINTEDVLGMKMNKAVTTISYRIVNTSSGKTVDMDSRRYRSSSRSPEEARHAAFESMATDVAQVIGQKTPKKRSQREGRLLADYKKKFEKGMKKESAAKKEPESASSPGYACPQIIILNPPVARGFEVVERADTVRIEGIAKDSSGIEFVKINAQPATVDTKGHFSHDATLSPGENRFLVVAMNSLGNTATKDIFINHLEDKSPPKIILTKPRVTRGFTVVVKGADEKALVEGLARDDSKLLYLRINGLEAAVDEEGHFSKEISLDKGEQKIMIEAADSVGNTTSKEFRIARGPGATRAVTPSGTKPVLWGLAIGVSGYDSTAVDLKYADDDAESLVKFLKRQQGKLFSEVHVRTLVNKGVTRDSIIESISTHLGKAAPDDVVFIFLAGHGIKHRQSGSYYFVPHDADFGSILTKGLRMSDFEEAVSILSKNVNKVVIAMDTCHSGAMQVGMRSGSGGENLAEALREASGLFILAASKGGEESLEDEKFKLNNKDSGHGAFTYALIEGMSGKANYDGDNYISLNELFQYVAKQVPRLTDGRQHPYFRTEGTDMPFVLLKD